MVDGAPAPGLRRPTLLTGVYSGRRSRRAGAGISRDDAPELAPALVASVFGEVEVRRWDAPLVTLPDPQAVRDFLLARTGY